MYDKLLPQQLEILERGISQDILGGNFKIGYLAFRLRGFEETKNKIVRVDLRDNPDQIEELAPGYRLKDLSLGKYEPNTAHIVKIDEIPQFGVIVGNMNIGRQVHSLVSCAEIWRVVLHTSGNSNNLFNHGRPYPGYEPIKHFEDLSRGLAEFMVTRRDPFINISLQFKS